ncbi:Sec34-like family-domain-containing protein, partial [Gymnopilus junonius]
AHAHRLLQTQASLSSTPSTPGTQANTPTHTHPHTPKPEYALLHPEHPVQNPQQFYDWFALIDRSVAHTEHLQACDLLLNKIELVEREVDGVLEGWRGVEESGKSLKGACERLLEERDSLVEIVDDIGDHLEYFQELEHATRMLNYPGESLIFQPDFLYMVERRHYKEAEVYLLRFQQCMTRAMTLVKMNFVGSLRALSSEIFKRLSDQEISTTAQHLLLYTRFKSLSTLLSPLLGELERRSQAYPDTLSSLLAECHSAYLSTRKALLVPRVMEEIRGLDPGRSELVQLTREGCGYLKGLCVDEWGLYREFFSTGEAGVYQYLESLCDLLYDDLRPRILHEPRLTVLCEVCTVLQALMVLDASSSSPTPSSSEVTDQSSSEDETSEPESEPESSSKPLQDLKSKRKRRTSTDQLTITTSGRLSPTSTTYSQKPNTARLGRRLHIAQLLKMVLQDAQTRLFFKAQAVIQSEIRYYVPKEGDLDMGFGGGRPNTTGTELREKESTNQLFQNVYALSRHQGGAGGRGGQETWYPTLSKTHITARGAGAGGVATSDGTPSPQSINAKLDGALFLVRHLLILKEMRVAEDEEALATAGLDKDRKKGLRSARLMSAGATGSISVGGGGALQTTSLLPEGLFASLADMRGVKLDIDHSLRQACEDVIAACAAPLCDPLELDGFFTAASQPDISTIHLHFLESVQRDLPLSVARVRAYLVGNSKADTTTSSGESKGGGTSRDNKEGDERTVQILLDHVVDRILGSYERWGEAVRRFARGGAGVDVLSSTKLKEMLRGVCGDTNGFGVVEGRR